MDYYSILDLESSANDHEIKKSYRKLALRWHPDKNSSPEAAEKFKEICQAYEILSDPEKRRLYDNRGHKPSTSKNYQESFMRGHDPFTGFHFHSPEQVFASFFGGRDPFAEMFGPSQFMPPMRPSFGGSSMFGGDPFDDPFFTQPFGGMRPVPGYAGTSFSMSTSSSSGGMMSSRSKSVSRTTRVINGRPQTVTVTKISDEQGTRTIEDYGNGQQRVLVNGVEQRNDIEGGSQQGGYLPAPNEDLTQYNSPYGMPQQQYPPMYYQRQPSFWDRW
ncbi:hypothetical protein VKS41_007035 [Umbelopsis sp. WA50703]